MKRIFAFIICLISLFLLVSCDGDGANPVVEDVKLEVKFRLNSAKSANSRVCIDTNMPVGTKFRVDIFVGNRYHSKEIVEVQGDMQSNYFITERQVDVDGQPIKEGNYIFSAILVDPAEQSEEVRRVIGENGEKLSGIYTYDTETGKTAKFQRPLVKKKDFFSMPDN